MNRDGKRLEVVARFLEGESTLSLATATSEGAASVAPLFYLPQDGLCLYWFSSARSEHSRNLERDPRAAVTVYRPTAEWRQIRGVQMRGTVSVVADATQRGEIAEAYAERFHLGKLFETAIGRSVLYRFQPEWLRYLDNSRRFGYQFELQLAP